MERKKIALLMGGVLIIILIAGLWYLNSLTAWKLYGYVIDYDGTPMGGIEVTLEEIEGEFVDEFTTDRHQKHFKTETDGNGYYEFRNTFLADVIMQGRWILKVEEEIGGSKYVGWEDDVFIYAKDQEKNIGFLDKESKEAHKSFSNAVIQKFESFEAEMPPGGVTGVTCPRVDVSGLGKYYIQMEERYDGVNYSILFTLGADGKTVKEVDPILITDSRVWVLTEDTTYEGSGTHRSEDIYPGHKNLLGLGGVGEKINPTTYRISGKDSLVYMRSAMNDHLCEDASREHCSDAVFMSDEEFKKHFTILIDPTPTSDSNMHYVTYEFKYVTEFLKEG